MALGDLIFFTIVLTAFRDLYCKLEYSPWPNKEHGWMLFFYVTWVLFLFLKIYFNLGLNLLQTTCPSQRERLVMRTTIVEYDEP